MVGLAALYRGFAIGAMGIVAPISAAAQIVPLIVDVARRRARCAAVARGRTGAHGHRRPVAGTTRRWTTRRCGGAGLAVVAALGFGLFFVGIDASSDERRVGSDCSPLRVGSGRDPGGTHHLDRAQAAAGDASDARRRGCVRHALQRVRRRPQRRTGAVGIVAVLSSLYPVVTVVLAWIVLQRG